MSKYFLLQYSILSLLTILLTSNCLAKTFLKVSIIHKRPIDRTLALKNEYHEIFVIEEGRKIQTPMKNNIYFEITPNWQSNNDLIEFHVSMIRREQNVLKNALDFNILTLIDGPIEQIFHENAGSEVLFTAIPYREND